MENAAQTQPNRREVRGVRFYAKSSLAQKPDRVKKKYSVKVTHKKSTKGLQKASAIDTQKHFVQFSIL